MTNRLTEHEPIADKSDTPLSAVALEFANIVGRSLAQKWIQDQADARQSARTGETDVSPDTEVQFNRSE